MSAVAPIRKQAREAHLTEATEMVEQQLLVLFRKARVGFEQLARDVHPGLDAAAYGILYLVDTGTATTVTALAEHLLVGKPTVSRQVSALEGLGLLARQSASESGRGRRLTLTAHGQAGLTAARSRRRERFHALLGEWPAAEVAALGEQLTRFNQLDW